MDLWIRSQDREILCKADCVDMMHFGGGNANIFLNCTFPDLIVGTYTKERALEVLDEIQYSIKSSYKIFATAPITDIEKEPLFIKSSGIELKSEQQQVVIYQMPEE